MFIVPWEIMVNVLFHTFLEVINRVLLGGVDGDDDNSDDDRLITALIHLGIH